ncbi:MAG: hypothetical protein II916_10095 [Oscillospiraceae bacterium]|nr:hypothetical protein [Oscillospiraceae bacterium]
MKRKESEPDSRIPEVLAGAWELAMFLLPVHFLLCLLSWCVGDVLLLVTGGGALLLSGILSAAAVRSDALRYSFAKCLLSMPITVLYWWIQLTHQLHDRALGFACPDYGTPSAGGMFAGAVTLLAVLSMDGLGVLIGLLVTQEQSRIRFWNGLQKTAFPVSLCIFLSIVILDTVMPSVRSQLG